MDKLTNFSYLAVLAAGWINACRCCGGGAGCGIICGGGN